MPTEIIEWIDTLDVWGLAVMCGFGFYKLMLLLQSVGHSLSLVEHRLTQVDAKLEQHIISDSEQHNRLEAKMDRHQEYSYEQDRRINEISRQDTSAR